MPCRSYMPCRATRHLVRHQNEFAPTAASDLRRLAPRLMLELAEPPLKFRRVDRPHDVAHSADTPLRRHESGETRLGLPNLFQIGTPGSSDEVFSRRMPCRRSRGAQRRARRFVLPDHGRRSDHCRELPGVGLPIRRALCSQIARERALLHDRPTRRTWAARATDDDLLTAPRHPRRSTICAISGASAGGIG